MPFNCQRQTSATLLTINSLQTSSLKTTTARVKKKKKHTGKKKKRKSLPSTESSFPSPKRGSFLCREHFHIKSPLVLFRGFFFEFCFSFSFFKEVKRKKRSQKNPQGQRQPIFTIENLQTQEKKNTIQRRTEEADQKTLQASQDPPQSQLEPVFLHH